MQVWISKNKSQGFTLVELLIVIVIIGILATISIIGYGAVVNHAHRVSIQQDLDSAGDLIGASYAEGSTHAYPVSLADVTALGIKASSGASLSYTANGSTNPTAYCLEEDGWSYTYFITNTSHNGPVQGYCQGYLGIPGASGPPQLSIIAGTGTSGAPVAGQATSSPLKGPAGLAVDNSGNVYIADNSGNVIEKVTPSGTLSIFAGTGTRGAPTPGPATSSMLKGPQGVAVDNSGNVYIADSGNYRVEKVTPSGTLSIIAGTGTATYPTPGPATSSALLVPVDVAVDNSGNIYIADQNASLIEKINSSGTLSIFAGINGHGPGGAPTPGPATSSTLNYVQGVAVDSSGNVYIADYENQRIEKVTPSGTLSVLAGTGGSGAPTPGPATSSKLAYPTDVAVDSAGNVYISDFDNSVVEEVTPDGTLSIFAGTGVAGKPTPGRATSSKLYLPWGLAVDTSGNVYLGDGGNFYVEKISSHS